MLGFFGCSETYFPTGTLLILNAASEGNAYD